MKPILTFLIYSYNQEDFIRHAVLGALSQTYKPLQIILSDDHSSDNTFNIMEEMAKDNAVNNNIILHQCPTNLGTRHHLNRAIQLAEGELIILAAGDDVSVPERTEKVYEAYLKGGKTGRSILSDLQFIDKNGQEQAGTYLPLPPYTHERFLKDKWHAYGASQAIHKEVFDYFGPLPFGYHEDQVLVHRALLLGTVEYIPMKLVKHRRHDSNISITPYHQQNLNSYKSHEKFGEKDSLMGNTAILSDYITHHSKSQKRISETNLTRIFNRIRFASLSIELYNRPITYIPVYCVKCIFYKIPLSFFYKKVVRLLKVFIKSNPHALPLTTRQ